MRTKAYNTDYIFEGDNALVAATPKYTKVFTLGTTSSYSIHFVPAVACDYTLQGATYIEDVDANNNPIVWEDLIVQPAATNWMFADSLPTYLFFRVMIIPSANGIIKATAALRRREEG